MKEITQKRRHSNDHKDMIVMILSEGDRSLAEIKENFYAFGRRFGFFAAPYIQRPGEDESFTWELKQDLDAMINLGWVECQCGKYALTEQGYAKQMSIWLI
jgi:hypothetical protein